MHIDNKIVKELKAVIRKGLIRLGLLVTTVMLVFGMLLVTTSSLPAFATDDDEASGSNGERKGVTDLSLYQRASELTREFATLLAPGGAQSDKNKSGQLYMLESTSSKDLLVAGNAGSMLGYADVLADDKGIVGWLMNNFTSASATISYDQLMHVVPLSVSKNASDKDQVLAAALENPFYQYAGYGELLTSMGLTKATPGSSANFLSIISSGITLFFYLLASAAPLIFAGALQLLVWLNPFRLFMGVFETTGSAGLGPLSVIADYVTNVFKAIQDLSLYVLIPFFLMTTVTAMLLFKERKVKQRLGKYGLRVFMIFAGLPLIGATYTGIVENMKQEVKVGSDYADYLVLSSYVDFEGWVKYSRLTPPSETKLYHPRYNEGAERTLTDRALVLEINGTRAMIDRANALDLKYKASSDLSKVLDEGGDKYDVSGSMTQEQKSSFQTIFSLLTRNMSNAHYTSSDYDGEVAGQIQKIRTSVSGKTRQIYDKEILHMYTLSSTDGRTLGQRFNPFDMTSEEEKKWTDAIAWNGGKTDGNQAGDSQLDSAKGLFTEGYALNPVFQFKPFGMNIYNSGDLRYDKKNGFVAPNAPAVVTSRILPIEAVNDRSKTNTGGLSPISMYNFLNTTFSSTGMVVYSPDKTASVLSRDAYMSVPFAGTGLSAFMRWLENVAVMGSLVFVTLSFGLMLITMAIRSIPRVLTSVFGTALGSIALITKLLITTIVLIMEIISIIFLYTLSENIIMTILVNMDQFVNTGATYFKGGSGALILDFITSATTIVVTVTVAFQLIRNINNIRNMIEEAVTTAINRLMSMVDKSVGGEGLDVAKTSGGRVDRNGLTDQAKQDDQKGARGLMGASDHLADGSFAKDALQGMGHSLRDAKDANELRALAGMEPKTAGEMLKDALKDGKDVAKAGFDDKLDPKGQHKDEALNAINGRSAALASMLDENGVTPASALGETDKALENMYQESLAESGGVDANGLPIAPDAPIALIDSETAMTDANGAIVDTNGDVLRDENGVPLHQNDMGQLVNGQGELMGIASDGTMKPISETGGTPMSAVLAASQLQAMRSDGEKYQAMREAGNMAHHGISAEGLPVGMDGEPMQVRGENGLETASFDSEGFIVNGRGERVKASDVVGGIDDKAFQMRENSDGSVSLQHRGEEAMKAGQQLVDSDQATLASLSKQANTTREKAHALKAHANQLRRDGAPSYAIKQADMAAKKASRVAKQASQAYTSEKNKATTGRRLGSHVSNVTPEHIAKAHSRVASSNQQLQQARAKLQTLKQSGASAERIAEQAKQVTRAEQGFMRSRIAENALKTSQSTGRPFGQIQQAMMQVERADQQYREASTSLANARSNGASADVIQSLEADQQQALGRVTEARAMMEVVSQPPKASATKRDMVNASVLEREAVVRDTARALQSLQSMNASAQQVQTARNDHSRAVSNYEQALQRREASMRPVEFVQSAAPRIHDVPTTSQAESYSKLASFGIVGVDDYKNRLAETKKNVSARQANWKLKTDRLKSLRASNRSASEVRAAMTDVQNAKKEYQQAQKEVQTLQENAHGLLKTGAYKPSVARSPLRVSGAVVANELQQLITSERLVNRLVTKQKRGVLSESERKELAALQQQAQYGRSSLQTYGLRSEALQNVESLENAYREVASTWSNFVKGAM